VTSASPLMSAVTAAAPHAHPATLSLRFSATLCVAVCCSVLECVAVCCRVLQCVAVCCCSRSLASVYETWPRGRARGMLESKPLHHAATHCNTRQPTAARRNALRHTATQGKNTAAHGGTCYGVATISRLLQSTGLFCKRAL